ncbi:(2Fe-2S)-binding protein [Govanella unica]|uniref:(2Fe-2S)-binding protein n=1 Tax=Govanella unica TaxID=2975056 RepID=A0A9X3TWU8_9PROT|nr:(2Fe-2S)-binding protein [Govania unica]MDA5193460.1 (2Fe-2S)-binding protein [Govania unica]
MSKRLDNTIDRGTPISIQIDDHVISCFAGETIATALLATGRLAFRRDQAGNPRGPVCNMGVCFECMVEIADTPLPIRRRACMTPVSDGMRIYTGTTEKRDGEHE